MYMYFPKIAFSNFVSNLVSSFYVTFKSVQAPIVVSIARSRHSESNGCGIMSGNALEPEL